MTFARDPLSVAFDPQASALIDKAITRYRRKQKNTTITAWTSGSVGNTLAHGVRSYGQHRLTWTELMFQRALYADQRIANLNRKWHPNARWSLKIAWDPAPLLPGQPRSFRLQVFRDTDGARYAQTLPKNEKFTENTDLRGQPGRERQAR